MTDERNEQAKDDHDKPSGLVHRAMHEQVDAELAATQERLAAVLRLCDRAARGYGGREVMRAPCVPVSMIRHALGEEPRDGEISMTDDKEAEHGLAILRLGERLVGAMERLSRWMEAERRAAAAASTEETAARKAYDERHARAYERDEELHELRKEGMRVCIEKDRGVLAEYRRQTEAINRQAAAMERRAEAEERIAEAAEMSAKAQTQFRAIGEKMAGEIAEAGAELEKLKGGV